MMLNEDQVLPEESDILSFHSDLPLPLPVPLPSLSSLSSSRAESLVQALRRNKNAIITLETLVSGADRFSLSDMPPPPPIPTQSSEVEYASPPEIPIPTTHIVPTVPQETYQTWFEGAGGGSSSHDDIGGNTGHTEQEQVLEPQPQPQPQSQPHTDVAMSLMERGAEQALEEGKHYTMNLDLSISIVENILCVLRHSHIESFDLKGLLRLSTKSAVSDRNEGIRDKVRAPNCIHTYVHRREKREGYTHLHMYDLSCI